VLLVEPGQQRVGVIAQLPPRSGTAIGHRRAHRCEQPFDRLDARSELRFAAAVTNLLRTRTLGTTTRQLATG